MEGAAGEQDCEGIGWLMVCAQLLEAVVYLHNSASILHNDIKSDNILVGRSMPSSETSSNSSFQTVLTDFGKATKISEAKLCRLTECKKAEYTRKYTHIPPEVIEGETRQSVYSDMFAVGGLLHKITDGTLLSSFPNQNTQL